MHFFDVVLGPAGPSPAPESAYSTRGFEMGAYEPANLVLSEAILSPNGDPPAGTTGTNTGRQCVVCSRTAPKTIFSCRYKVHDKNQTMLSDYFKRPLECGDLCDRCYRLWYKQKRATKSTITKTTKVGPSHHHSHQQHQTHSHHKQNQHQIVGKIHTPSMRHEACLAFSEQVTVLDSQMLDSTFTVRNKRHHDHQMPHFFNAPWPGDQLERSSFLTFESNASRHSDGGGFESLHEQASVGVESADIVTNREGSDQFEDQDDDHIVTHIETPRRHKGDDLDEPEFDHFSIRGPTAEHRPPKRRCIDEMNTSTFEELLWLSRPPRKSRRKATPLRSVMRETSISAVHVSTTA